MKLIDADALREQLEAGFGPDIKHPNLTKTKMRQILSAAPAVCCGECRYSPPPQVGAGGARRYCHDCFCGSYFERRAP